MKGEGMVRIQALSFTFICPLLLVNGQLDDTSSPKWYRLSYERKIKDMDRDD